MTVSTPFLSKWIYLDHHATTPVDPRVLKRMDTVARKAYGNPSSTHIAGRAAQRIVDDAREQIAEHIGALPGEITFTSGATEANNLVIGGLVRGASDAHLDRNKIVISEIEHKSVIKSAAISRKVGGECSEAPVNKEGLVDLERLSDLVNDETLLVSVQTANNEIGTIQAIREIARIAHKAGAWFHTDAVQALGRMELDVQDWNIDFLSLSAHKAYGPKGIGILYSKGGMSQYPLSPLVVGGGQERGVRAGTLNVPAIAGFGEACRICEEEWSEDVSRMSLLRDKFEDEVGRELDCVEIVGSTTSRLASTTNLRFKGLEADALLARLPNIAISTGSACESGAPEPSHVLQSLGLSRDAAYECVRVAVGRFTNREEVQEAAERVIRAGKELIEVRG